MEYFYCNVYEGNKDDQEEFVCNEEDEEGLYVYCCLQDFVKFCYDCVLGCYQLVKEYVGQDKFVL